MRVQKNINLRGHDGEYYNFFNTPGSIDSLSSYLKNGWTVVEMKRDDSVEHGWVLLEKDEPEITDTELAEYKLSRKDYFAASALPLFINRAYSYSDLKEYIPDIPPLSRLSNFDSFINRVNAIKVARYVNILIEELDREKK